MEGGFTGEKATDGIAMTVGVHGTEKVSGCLVVRSVLMTAPVHEQTMAEAAQHPQESHGPGMSPPTVIFQIEHIRALVKSAFLPASRQAIPQAIRLAASHCAAVSSLGGRLVIKATVSGAWVRRWRRSNATCWTEGKPSCSAVAARLRRMRNSGWPLLSW